MIIRPATVEDAQAIAAIWNSYIRDTTVTFTSDAKTEDEVAALIASRQGGGMSMLVAEIDARVVGFASAGPFRSGPGYVHTLESSLMLADQASGQGVGRRLMAEVEARAQTGGAHVLVAGISGENAAAIAFHAAIGFERVAHMPQVGRKFDRWLDLVLMQKQIGS